MEMAMPLQQYVRQVKPRNESYTPPVEKIQDLFEFSVLFETEREEEELDVNSLISALQATPRTQVLEAGAILVGMYGKKFAKDKIITGMDHPQFSPTAKKEINKLRKKYGDEEFLVALRNWFILVGQAMTEVGPGKFKDYIHKDIDTYYKVAPSTFQIPTADKANTADAVFIANGSKSDVLSSMKEISKLSDKDQLLRAKTDNKGKITLLNDSGKEVVTFYQVSLKKEAGAGARIGRATSFLNKNYIVDPVTGLGGISKPSKAMDTMARYAVEEDYILTEGWFGDVVDKFKNVVTGGIKTFISWAKGIYVKVAKQIAKFAERIVNKQVKRNKGMKALSSIMKTAGLREAAGDDVKITKGMKKEFELVQSDLIKKDLINKQHNMNIKLITDLNSKFKLKSRAIDPIIMVTGHMDGLIDTTSVLKTLKNVISKKEGDYVTREELQLALKLGMNYTGNVAIFSILKGVEKDISKYNNLSEALYAFAATIESEVKFGNTALPLVIVYGGKDAKAIVLGTRDDFTKQKSSELATKGKDLDNFPVLVFKINKSGGKEPYNVIKFLLVNGFVEENGEPAPEYLIFEVQTSSGSNFTTKIEASKTVRKWQ